MFKHFHPNISHGSGLGLYLIKKSAEAIKGEITFTDNCNGSLFALKTQKN
ncbi:MAG: sensor histidine kinase regulating citrate/malate metabolism [Cellvibrionaceae bacterium]|jgi:sensor histidine kinase regulating citrate/malate metabolism